MDFNILVIDDEEDIRDMICDCLELHELKIKAYKAKDGVEALAKMRNQKFDLIITDLNMPKMDGKQLISELKNLPKDFRPANIIVASGHVEKEMLKETPGGVSIISKKIYESAHIYKTRFK